MKPLWTVILAGGVGSRFWPLSTPARPKQLLPLISDRAMLEETFARLAPLAGPEHTLVLTSATLAAAVRAMLPQVPATQVIAEPRAAGTAAALTWAARCIAALSGRDAMMLSVHADWAVGDVPRFREVLRDAAAAAADTHELVTVGVVPQRPDTGLGYIVPGAMVHGNARRVERFVEKPTAERARELVAQGALWNSGIFAWCVGDLLDEVRNKCPEIASSLDAHPDDAGRFFESVQSPIAIDVGVLERSSRVLVLPGDFGWSDVGTWAALRDVRPRDADGNVASGPALLRESRDNVVHSDGTTVVLYGVSGLVVVAAGGVTLVTTVERAAELKSLLDTLPPEVRDR